MTWQRQNGETAIKWIYPKIVLDKSPNAEYIQALVRIASELLGNQRSALSRYKTVCGGEQSRTGAAAKACRDLESLWSQYSKPYNENEDTEGAGKYVFDMEDANMVLETMKTDATKVSWKYYNIDDGFPNSTYPKIHVPKDFNDKGKTDEDWACPSAKC
eukprot:GHVU01012200.1.p1 GENE.GHVU01012200.1~~GHVU01012200.1.p1  ORF type:complete len:159 (-),score=16.75 GHVU01012200.1:1033-1509(-)